MPSAARTTRWIPVVLAAYAAATAAGCGSASTTPGEVGFALVEAEMLDAHEVRLVFTEAVAPPTDVDPADFHLSSTQRQVAGEKDFRVCLGYGICYGHYAACPSPGYCHAATAADDETFYYDEGALDGLRAGDAPNELIGHLKTELGTFHHPVRSTTGGEHRLACGDVHLHYRPAEHAVQAAGGAKLAPIAPARVDSTDNPLVVPGDLVGAPLGLNEDRLASFCAGHGCSDGLLDSRESDVDCGGSCARCDLGKRCNDQDDCVSRACGPDGTCAAPTCDDGQHNQSETGVDCGGDLCPKCADDQACKSADDCASAYCVERGGDGLVCATPTCHDGTRNQGETDFDCGGPCGACLGAPCAAASDCASGVCDAVCASPTVTAISISQYVGCAETSVGLKCWGRNTAGSLGAGTRYVATTPLDVSGISGANVFAAGTTSCAVDGAGALLCWGADSYYGLLGDGAKGDRATPTPVVDFPPGALSVSTSGTNSCAVTAAGAAMCWGLADDVGDGTDHSRRTPTQVLGLSSGVTSIGVGDYLLCAATSAGAVQCWGGGHLTPVPIPLTAPAKAIAVGSEHACALTAAGGVMCWGSNGYGELGNGTTGGKQAPGDVVGLTSGVVGVAAGNDHACAVLATGGVKCWGRNVSGALGDGTTKDRKSPVDVVGLPGPVTAVAAGGYTTCALTATGHVLCWGDGPALGSGQKKSITPSPVYGL